MKKDSSYYKDNDGIDLVPLCCDKLISNLSLDQYQRLLLAVAKPNKKYPQDIETLIKTLTFKEKIEQNIINCMAFELLTVNQYAASPPEYFKTNPKYTGLNTEQFAQAVYYEALALHPQHNRGNQR